MADAAHLLVALEAERLDGRTRYAKRLRALVTGLLEELGGPPTVADQLLATQKQIGLSVRSGLHTGEIKLRGYEYL